MLPQKVFFSDVKFLVQFTEIPVMCFNTNMYLPTLVYQIDVQYKINVQVGKFLKNIKRAGQNRRAGGKLSGKSINVQGGKFMENQ